MLTILCGVSLFNKRNTKKWTEEARLIAFLFYLLLDVLIILCLTNKIE